MIIPIQQAYLERNPGMDAYDVHILAHKTSSGNGVVQPLTAPVITHVPSGTYAPPTPAFQLSTQSAQAMLDGLWAAGIRPSSGLGKVQGQEVIIELMKEHLSDLRRVVFGPPAEPRSPDQPSTHPTY